MNSRNRCIVCLDDFTDDEINGDNPIIKHHVKYFPEVIAYVHYRCHQKIHDPENPIEHLIQYVRKDSIKFYKMKKLEEENCQK